MDVLHDHRVNAAHGWLQEVTDSSRVEIRAVRLVACIGARETTLAGSIYEPNVGGADGGFVTGGLFSRVPWYRSTKSKLVGTLDGAGVVVLSPMRELDRMWHVWNREYPRPAVPPGAGNIRYEVEARISGPAQMRIGIDYWTSRTAGTNVEAGASAWYTASPAWQTIVVGLACGAALDAASGASESRAEGILGAIPSPSTGAVHFSVRTSGPQTLTLEIADVMGRVVACIPAACGGAGVSDVYWDGRPEGTRLPAGAYFVRVRGIGANHPVKFVLL